MWTYVQRTGELFRDDGERIAIGYAGLGEHKNRPESQELRDRGPLPCGRYAIGPPHATTAHGPYVMRLCPDAANEMFDRAGFLIHGDSRTRPGAASNGCLVLPPAVRTEIWTSGDRTLRVVAEHIDV